MAYGPVNARSEFVTSTNCSDGGDFDTIRRFQAASAASIFPARSPTRGSGLGAAVDRLVGDGLPVEEDEVECAHAASARRPSTWARGRSRRDAMRFPSWRRWTDGYCGA